MNSEIARTILVPLFIILFFLVGRALFLKLRRWRKRRMIERGITDLANHIHGTGIYRRRNLRAFHTSRFVKKHDP